MDIDSLEQEEKDEEETTPSKYIRVNVEIDVACDVKYIDFEGLSDGKSIKMILQRVSPKKLVPTLLDMVTRCSYTWNRSSFAEQKRIRKI